MSADLTVHHLILARSARDWADRVTLLRTARGRLDDAPLGGFSPTVAAAAEPWVATWRDVVEQLSASATHVGEQLTEAHRAYATSDTAARERFEAWLVGGP